jgi:UDP-glucose 4-epimerase
MKILVTGGAGYIGSHTVVELLNAGYDVVVLDNLSNSKEEALKRVKRITGKDFKFYLKDLNYIDEIREVFAAEKIDAVIHFAGLKAVGESVRIPLRYYQNNINGTLNLIQAMTEYNVKNIVFSSSATVYGNPHAVPIKEDFPLSATNPYGRTKLFIEQILADVYQSDKNFNIVVLRYFNPIGAHKSGLIGEDPNGIPNNLMPYITQVAIGKLPYLNVFGDDYDTPDGTGVRDYIHVVDLAVGHIKSLDVIKRSCGYKVYNLGTGRGYSVLEVVNAFKDANNVDIPYKIAPRRPGDVAVNYADPSLAQKELGWKAENGIFEMCADSWNWQKNNPQGYDD